MVLPYAELQQQRLGRQSDCGLTDLYTGTLVE